MATRTRDVAESVNEVVAAFDQAAKYVRRIEDRKGGADNPEAIHDLYKSLALGPTIVQGYFDADSKRLGPSYIIGDPTAQFQLRDVLYSLRTLVSELQSALLDDKELNYKELQNASDTCRVNAGVCLGQLSQRLTEVNDHMRLGPHSPNAYMSSYSSPSLDYSSSRSTHSSVRERMPPTPDPFYAQHSLTPYWQIQRSESVGENYKTTHRRQDTETSIQDSYTDWLDTDTQSPMERDPDQFSMRRPSSHTLAPEDGALLSPALPPDSPQSLLPGQLDQVRDSYTSFNSPSDTQSQGRGSMSSPPSEKPTRERYGPDDFSPIDAQRFGLFSPERRDERQSVSSYAQTAYDDSQHSGLELFLPPVTQSYVPQPLRLPHRPVARTGSVDSQGRPLRKPVAQNQSSPPSAYNTRPSVPYGTEQQQQSANLIPVQTRMQPQPSSTLPPQRAFNPPTHGQSYLPSKAVQVAMARNYARQYNVDNTTKYNTGQNSVPSPPQPFSSTLATVTSRTPPHTASNSPPSVYPAHTQNQFVQSPTVATPTAQPPQQQQQQFPPRSPPPPILSPTTPTQSQTHLALRSQRTTSVSSIPIPQNLPLSLPTEKNTHPFCKGAFRLLIGLTKKAFVDAVRPVGMTSTMSYWRCDKCFFEGPMYTIPGPLDKKGRPGKPEKVFDPTIRESGPMSTAIVGADGRGEGSGGVRYKWAFLAKCHVPQKHIPIGKQSEVVGGFGCIFCAAEGQVRGWTGPNGTLTSAQGFGGAANDAASTLSGKSGHTSSGGGANTSGATPIFGNIRTFMDHLQLHRREDAWPCAEMQGRMKCVVGRLAERTDDFEINFLPI